MRPAVRYRDEIKDAILRGAITSITTPLPQYLARGVTGYISKLREFLQTAGTRAKEAEGQDDVKVKQIALRTNENIQVRWWEVLADYCSLRHLHLDLTGILGITFLNPDMLYYTHAFFNQEH